MADFLSCAVVVVVVNVKVEPRVMDEILQLAVDEEVLIPHCGGWASGGSGQRLVSRPTPHQLGGGGGVRGMMACVWQSVWKATTA